MSLVRSHFSPSTQSLQGTKRLACLVAGFAGKVKHFNRAIAELNERGYDVIAFEYDNHILDTGEPQNLIDVVAEVERQVRELASPYDDILCTGPSLGAYIAINVQRRFDRLTHGVYATAGVKVSGVVFHTRVFSKIKRAFAARGYTEASLLEAWRELEDQEPRLAKTQSLVVVLAGADRIVRHADAVRLLEDWKSKGITLTYFTKRGIGHSMAIRWYNRHLGELLDRM